MAAAALSLAGSALAVGVLGLAGGVAFALLPRAGRAAPPRRCSRRRRLTCCPVGRPLEYHGCRPHEPARGDRRLHPGDQHLHVAADDPRHLPGVRADRGSRGPGEPLQPRDRRLPARARRGRLRLGAVPGHPRHGRGARPAHARNPCVVRGAHRRRHPRRGPARRRLPGPARSRRGPGRSRRRGPPAGTGPRRRRPRHADRAVARPPRQPHAAHGRQLRRAGRAPHAAARHARHRATRRPPAHAHPARRPEAHHRVAEDPARHPPGAVPDRGRPHEDLVRPRAGHGAPARRGVRLHLSHAAVDGHRRGRLGVRGRHRRRPGAGRTAGRRAGGPGLGAARRVPEAGQHRPGGGGGAGDRRRPRPGRAVRHRRQRLGRSARRQHDPAGRAAPAAARRG